MACPHFKAETTLLKVSEHNNLNQHNFYSPVWQKPSIWLAVAMRNIAKATGCHGKQNLKQHPLIGFVFSGAKPYPNNVAAARIMRTLKLERVGGRRCQPKGSTLHPVLTRVNMAMLVPLMGAVTPLAGL
jgi:hypothetical protein